MRVFKIGLLGALLFSAQLSASKALDVGYGHLSARALHTACYFKLFDFLESGPKSAEQLALSANLKAEPVKRIMRVIANHDLVNMDMNGRFSLNENSKVLLSGTPGSLQAALAKEFDDKRWAAIGNLQAGVVKGEIAFDSLFGKSFYAYLEGDSKAAALFNAGMKAFSDSEDDQIVRHFPFASFQSYCDIGGGTGGLVKKVINVAPKLQTSLFELPSALAGVSIPGVKLVEGSFFVSAPPAQLYSIKRVLHNWDDEQAVTILTNAKNAIADRLSGRILVIEKVMPKTIDHTLLIDSEIIGLAIGGKERTLDEFDALGKKAGLKLERLIPLERVSIMVFKLVA